MTRCAILLAMLLLAACGKSPTCSERTMQVTTYFDGRTLNDRDLTAANIACWTCYLSSSENVAGILQGHYTCTRCD